MANECVEMGPADAEQLRRIWLDMLACAPGVFFEPLDEALDMTREQWAERAAVLSGRYAAVIGVRRPDGRIIAFVAGYLDQEGEEIIGQISFLYSELADPGDSWEAVVTAMSALCRWFEEREAATVYIAVREDQPFGDRTLRSLGFEATGARRPSELDPEKDEVEYVFHAWDPLRSSLLHSAGLFVAGA